MVAKIGIHLNYVYQSITETREVLEKREGRANFRCPMFTSTALSQGIHFVPRRHLENYGDNLLVATIVGLTTSVSL